MSQISILLKDNIYFFYHIKIKNEKTHNLLLPKQQTKHHVAVQNKFKNYKFISLNISNFLIPEEEIINNCISDRLKEDILKILKKIDSKNMLTSAIHKKWS